MLIRRALFSFVVASTASCATGASAPAPGRPAEPSAYAATPESIDARAEAPAAAGLGARSAPRPQRLAMAEGGAVAGSGARDKRDATAAKLLVYTASVTIAVFEVRKTLDALEELGRGLGGYLLSRADRSVTVRVPAASFQRALDDVAKLGDVLRQDVQAQDVTDQVFDLEVRLRNARAVRERLEKLLANAQKVDEALQVERELARLGEEIERLEGQLKRMAELVAYSTISVSLQAPAPAQVQTGVRLPFPWLDTLGLPQLLEVSR